ncbi:MAG TPA: hypothetical protein V6D25_07960 [Leptolyngbyaceae cyanobacterium]
MLSNTKNNLFTEVSFEESATVSGGDRGRGTYVDFDWNTYFFILGTGVVTGQNGLTSDETLYAWKKAIDVD